MRMQHVAIFGGVFFVLCCVCCVWPCISFASELSVEPVADSSTSGPVASDADVTVDEVAGPVMLGANPLAASATTLDTVNNNVLALRDLFGDSVFWWNNYNFPTDSGVSIPVAITLRQWLMTDKLVRSYNGVDYDVTTLYGRVKHVEELVSDIHRYTEATEINVNNLSDEVGTIKSAVSDIKTAVGSGSGSVSIASEQWQVLSSTIQFQNFALLVLTLLSSASIGCSLWASFSKGWRR